MHQKILYNLTLAFNITVAIDLLQNAFGVDIADKTQVDLYKLEEPLEVCYSFHAFYTMQ